MFEDPLWPEMRDVLTRYRRIAVVGLSDRPHRDSYRVSRHMMAAGYEILPVNPEVEEVFGLRSYDNLLAAPGVLEIVNVFRRPEFVPEVVEQAIERNARCIWMQLGVTHEKAAETARRAGLTVIMDRCIMVELQRLHLKDA